GDVTGLVTDRVGIDLGRAQPADEAAREPIAQLGEGARVVRGEDGGGAGPGGDRRQLARHAAECLLPGDRAEDAAPLGSVPELGRQQTGPRVDEGAVVGGRALPAQATAADVVIAVASDVPERAIAHGDLDAARVVAVTRAGRADGALARARLGCR